MSALTSYPISPMANRPDTTARLAVEDRGMSAVLAACENTDAAMLTITAALYPSVNFAGVLLRPIIQN